MPIISHSDTEPGKTSARYATPENHAYFCPTPGEITRLALMPNKLDAVPPETFCETIAECGFNAATLWFTSVPTGADKDYPMIKQAISYCRKCGIAPFFLANNLTRNADARKDLVTKFAGCSNLAGWCLYSPTYNQIAGHIDGNDYTRGEYAEAYNAIWNIDKDKGNPESHHIIIMAAMSNKENAQADYRDYLIQFQNNVSPSLWVTSVYPLACDKNGNNVFKYDLFFKDLEILALVSRYCGRPFWYTVRCQSYVISSGSYEPYPTVEEMRFAAFSALAYGAQGLEFWSYRLRDNEPTVTYQHAPVDRNGTKEMAICDAVNTVNNEIKALNSVFFGSFLVDVRHTGSKQYDATKMLRGAVGPLVSIVTEAAGVLVSHLNTNGQDYLVIVNHAFANSQPASQKIKLTFDHRPIVRQVLLTPAGAAESVIPSKVLEINLPRAGYLIYKWS